MLHLNENLNKDHKDLS